MAQTENHDWLDKIIAEQQGINTKLLGDANLVTEVAAGITKFGDDFFDS